MKNIIKYIIFIFVLLFINIFYVNASCTDGEYESLKLLTKEIKITYKHKGIVENEDGIFYNMFDVNVKNIDNDMYISLNNGSTILNPVNNVITSVFNNGTWNFDIYSKKCEQIIDTIKVHIPRFNIYSLDPLCEGIDGNDFALCGKYYEYDVDYDNFEARVKHYRLSHNIENKVNYDDNNENKDGFSMIINKLLDYIIVYRLYIIIALVILLVILIAISIIKRREKRGVLE